MKRPKGWKNVREKSVQNQEGNIAKETQKGSPIKGHPVKRKYLSMAKMIFLQGDIAQRQPGLV